MDKELTTIDELASASGFTVRTIRFYTQEGILPPPTDYNGRVALYTREHQKKLNIIKELKENFVPLSLIKSIMENPEKLGHIQERLKTSSKVFELLGHKPRELSSNEIAKKSNLSVKMIDELTDQGFLCLGKTEIGPRYSENDLEIASSIAQLKELGFYIDDLAFIPKILKDLADSFFKVGHDKVKRLKKKGQKQALADIEKLLTAQRELIGKLFQQFLRQAIEEHRSGTKIEHLR